MRAERLTSDSWECKEETTRSPAPIDAVGSRRHASFKKMKCSVHSATNSCDRLRCGRLRAVLPTLDARDGVALVIHHPAKARACRTGEAGADEPRPRADVCDSRAAEAPGSVDRKLRKTRRVGLAGSWCVSRCFSAGARGLPADRPDQVCFTSLDRRGRHHHRRRRRDRGRRRRRSHDHRRRRLHAGGLR